MDIVNPSSSASNEISNPYPGGFDPSPPVPLPISHAAQDGSLVLFIGAGISRLIGCPSWDGFAQEVLAQLTPQVINYHEKKLIESIPDPRKQLSIAKIIEKESANFSVDYKKIFEQKNDKEENIYKYINKYSCSFVTTNYDKFICPDHMNGRSETEWRFHRRDEILAANLDARGSVVHLHGCIDRPESMVITTRDYLSHYSSGEIPKFLTHLFSRKTVLFLGYGLEEVEVLEHVLKNSHQAENGNVRLFILQGFYNSDLSLFNKLKKFYKDSFNADLIGFPLDFKYYDQQVEIIKRWQEELTFIDVSLVDEVAIMEAELRG